MLEIQSIGALALRIKQIFKVMMGSLARGPSNGSQGATGKRIVDRNDAFNICRQLSRKEVRVRTVRDRRQRTELVPVR